MFDDPILILFTFLICLGLLYCFTTLVQPIESSMKKTLILMGSFLVLISFISINYQQVSNYTESQSLANNQLMNSVEKLEEILLNNPKELQAIKVLGSHYVNSGEYQLAYEKFLKGYEILGKEKDFEINLGLIETTLMVRPDSFPYDIDLLIEETLEMNPENTQILWLAGLIAMGRGDADLTIKRWSGLVNNPEVSLEIQNSIATQLGQLKQMEEGISILND
jgi:cytochrome c-type biogenesis protein CcmH/NrfG